MVGVKRGINVIDRLMQQVSQTMTMTMVMVIQVTFQCGHHLDSLICLWVNLWVSTSCPEDVLATRTAEPLHKLPTVTDSMGRGTLLHSPCLEEEAEATNTTAMISGAALYTSGEVVLQYVSITLCSIMGPKLCIIQSVAS